MKRPIFRMALAAGILVACAVGLSLWSGTQSIALADVLNRIEQVRAYMYQMNMTITMSQEIVPGQSQSRQTETQGTILFAPEYGMKTTMNMNVSIDPNQSQKMKMVQEQYLQPDKKRMLMIMPNEKKYAEMELNEQILEKSRNQNNDPRMMIEQLLTCDYQKVGKSHINGIEVDGFQTNDPAYMGGAMGDVDVILWVDSETRLPVQVDMDMEIAGQMHMTGAMTDFQWDVPVDASVFDPVIPDDYTSLTGEPIKMPEMDETAAIEGLRLFAGYTGRYPEELNLMKLMAEIGDILKSDTPAGQALKNSVKNQDEEAMSKTMVDTMLPLQAAGGFYALLVREKKDPVYYGDIVTPETPDLVLLRWKISDDEYRVIFGDLGVQTVTSAQLAELESLLPK